MSPVKAGRQDRSNHSDSLDHGLRTGHGRVLHPRHGIRSPDEAAKEEMIGHPVVKEHLPLQMEIVEVGISEVRPEELGETIGLLARMRREQGARPAMLPPAPVELTSEAPQHSGELSQVASWPTFSPSPDKENWRSGRPSHSHRKRHRHTSGSEHLSQEVSSLKLRNSQLEEFLDQASHAQQTLEEQLDKAQQHRVELERLAHDGERLAHEGIASGKMAVAMGENQDLRKQLAAYAVEIDVLRHEKTELTQSLAQAEKKTQRLRTERHELLSSKGKASQALEEAGCVTQEQAANLAELRRRKDLKIAELSDLVEDLQRALAVSQEGFIRQTKEFDHFVHGVRQLQHAAGSTLDEAGKDIIDHLPTASSLGTGLGDLNRARVESIRRAEAAAADEEDEEEKEKQKDGDSAHRRRRPHRQRANPPGASDRPRLPHSQLQLLVDWRQVLQEIVKAREGLHIEKVGKRSGKLEPRRVVLADREMLLCWAHKQQENKSIYRRAKEKYRQETDLDLFDVIRVEYGSMSRACVLHHTTATPWHCFSMYTSKRSYDFVCPDDDTTRCLVTVVSRLCNWAAGAVRSRRAFECLKGWCKINEYCFAAQKTLARVFCDACYKAAESEDREYRPRHAMADADRRGIVVPAALSRSHEGGKSPGSRHGHGARQRDTPQGTYK